jgi:hypothetical protein
VFEQEGIESNKGMDRHIHDEKALVIKFIVFVDFFFAQLRLNSNPS